MLKRSKDWCYSEVRWHGPAEMQRLDRWLKIDRSNLHVAGYLFVSPELAHELKLPQGEALVVGRPQAGQQFQYLLCDGHELTKKPGRWGKDLTLRGEPLHESAEARPKRAREGAKETAGAKIAQPRTRRVKN